MYDAYSCGFDGVIIRPKRAHKRQTHISATFYPVKVENQKFNNPPRTLPRIALDLLCGQFGYLWVTLGHLMVTSQSLWSHFGYMKVRFQKTLISPTDFNDFV